MSRAQGLPEDEDLVVLLVALTPVRKALPERRLGGVVEEERLLDGSMNGEVGAGTSSGSEESLCRESREERTSKGKDR